MYNYVKNSLIKGMTYMKPRIFISSTCYDLKFVREDLGDFVRTYNYEPIQSENGDIGYTPGQNLDKSCYVAMQTADMVILIIGSEYGSAASGEIKDKFKEYISITRNEFRTAIDAGIPVFAMIDKKVMTEYGIYEVNMEEIEKNDFGIKFKIVKDLNIFRFIKEIKSMINIPIQEFEKSSDIKEFIGKQWADMFKQYLVSLKEERENKKIENSVNEMKALIQKMDIMLDSVGKNVLSKEDSKEYESVINQQEITSFCNKIIEVITIQLNNTIDNFSDVERKIIITDLLIVLKEIGAEGNLKTIRVAKGKKSEELYNNFKSRWGEIEYQRQKEEVLVVLERIIKLLSDMSNIDKIVEVMKDDMFFKRLIGI